MVPNPRTTLGAHGLRPLGLPRLLTVEVNEAGRPVAVMRARRLHRITHLAEVWRVCEAWWRDDFLQRTYVRALLDDGTAMTIFHDDEEAPADGWHEQHY